jgi:transaldolase/glucose-6-phosphate isomerase
MIFRFAESIFDEAMTEEAERWSTNRIMERIWERDTTVFAPVGTPEIEDRLGWLDLATSSRTIVPGLDRLRNESVASGVRTVVLCGMGGSSLAPEVFAKALRTDKNTELIVVDTTHPDAIAAIGTQLDIDTTWFVISSKSGSTIETISAMEFFWQMVTEREPNAGERFIAVTDPDSSLSRVGSERGFRAVFLADSDVGGRFSALTHFGLVPASLIGLDVGRMLDHAEAAAALCGPKTPVAANPAFTIGSTMALHASRGVDKTRFVGSGAGAYVGTWVEQLIAESTGKDGRGRVPIDDGPHRPGATDEITVGIAPDAPSGADVGIGISDPHSIAGIMFILELATAVAGEILGIHPFNQPDVQRAKELASAALKGELGSDPVPQSIRDASIGETVSDAIGGRAVSYIGIHAYVAPSHDVDAALARLRSAISDSTGKAVTVGYGPRFLHSTGQLHKGGPSGGVFLQLVDRPEAQVAIPRSGTTFNALIEGQAIGDRRALLDAGRTVVSIDLESDPAIGITALANRIAR